MNLVKLANKTDVAKYASEWCSTLVSEQSIRSFYIPAGGTPKELYHLWETEKPNFLSDLDLIQIDDVISGTKSWMFENFFKQELPSYLDQIHWIKQREPLQADAAILGLGLNGHIAFHEPELPNDFAYGEVELSEQSRLTLDLEDGTKGLSYGLGSFLKCQAIIMLVTGHAKKEVLTRLINADKSLPATGLIGHKNLTIVCDQEAIA